LSLKLIQIGFLVLLWVLVLSVAAVMRSDLYARRRQRAGRAERSARARAKANRPVPAVAGTPLGADAQGATGVTGMLATQSAAAAAAAGASTAAGGATGSAVATDSRTAKQSKQPKPSRPPKPRRGAPKMLVVTAGPGVGTQIELGGSPVSIGRAAENTLVLDDDYVSGRHARLFPHEGAWVVEDLGSTNGTYLDRTRLTAPIVVPVGTPVRIGKTVLELRK